MADKLTPRALLVQRLGMAVVAGLLIVTLAAGCLWLTGQGSQALAVFSIGVALCTVVSVWAGRLSAEEQRSLEERLAARDARYRQTLELLPEGVVILRDHWQIEWVNSTALRHLGLRPADQGSNFLEHIESADFREWMRQKNYDRRFSLIAPDDSLILDVAVVAPDSRHMIIVTHDVTERRRLDDMRRDFVANVSHELRTPLTVIAGFLSIPDEDMPGEIRNYHRQLMREQTERMRRLTDDLLMLSHLENKDEHAAVEPELIAVPRLVDDVVKEGRALSAGRHTITADCEDVSLVGFPDEIRSAVMNLVSNAVRYTPDGGSITVTWRREGTGAALTVADTGIGIAAEHIPRITERFYRVEKGRSRETGGTGLGLAIVKHVLRRNGGELRIRSTPGKGSAFTFRFPEERIFVPQSL